MPIEFRCTQCNKLLRTGDDTAGKQAKCPECGAFMTVPAPVPPPPEPPGPGVPPPPPPPPPPGADVASPFGAGAAEPIGASDSENPYEAPTQYGQTPQPFGMPDPLAANRVSGPAIGLIVTGAIGIPFQVLAIVINLMTAGGAGGFGMMGRQQMPMMFSGGINVVLNVISLIIGVVVILGALKMKNLQSYAFAMSAAIIAMIPCISPCCLLGLPFGIWALVVLCDAQVKAAFRG